MGLFIRARLHNNKVHFRMNENFISVSKLHFQTDQKETNLNWTEKLNNWLHMYSASAMFWSSFSFLGFLLFVLLPVWKMTDWAIDVFSGVV